MQQTSVTIIPQDKPAADNTSSLRDVPQKWTPGGSNTSGVKSYKPIKPDFSKQAPEITPKVSFVRESYKYNN